jgi:hypothetical protein
MTNHPDTFYTGCMNSEEHREKEVLSARGLYQIVLAGMPDHARLNWFAEMGFKTALSNPDGEKITILTGQVIDQAHLRGILNKFWDLNFEVIQVSRLDYSKNMGGQDDG